MNRGVGIHKPSFYNTEKEKGCKQQEYTVQAIGS